MLLNQHSKTLRTLPRNLNMNNSLSKYNRKKGGSSEMQIERKIRMNEKIPYDEYIMTE